MDYDGLRVKMQAIITIWRHYGVTVEFNGIMAHLRERLQIVELGPSSRISFRILHA